MGAILAANHAGVPVETINQLAALYLASRVAYNVTYIFLQENRSLAPVRSLVVSKLYSYTDNFSRSKKLLFGEIHAFEFYVVPESLQIYMEMAVTNPD
jgi:hypothetical protein